MFESFYILKIVNSAELKSFRSFCYKSSIFTQTSAKTVPLFLGLKSCVKRARYKMKQFCFCSRQQRNRPFLQQIFENFPVGRQRSLWILDRVSEAGYRSRGIWQLEPQPSLWQLEPEPSLWPGSGSSLHFSLIIHANCMVPA